jgi:hypothetical protein
MLKPSQMGVVGIKQTIATHKRKVINKLTSMTKTKGRQKNVAEVCLGIIEKGNGSIVDISKLETFEVNEIKNYFAEVMGPIWVQEGNLISGIKSSDYTYFSPSDTERLYDFKVFRGKEEILISNKQKKGGTNTLKPVDVVHLVRKNKSLSDKWANTKYYKVFEILDSNNVVSGPIKAISKCYPKLTNIKPSDYIKVINQLIKNDVVLEDVPNSIMNLIQSDPTAAKRYEETEKVTGTMINFIFEKLLVQQSEQDSKYHDLFVDVTDGNVMFLKFDLSNKGKITFLIESPKESKKKAKLRSKQGVERRSSSGRLKLDKLGFQP